MINLGGLASILTAVTEKFKGFGFAFLVPLCLVVISVTTFQFGSSNYGTQFIPCRVFGPLTNII